MTLLEPDFMSSPYFVDEFNNWHLLPGAPEKVKKEFDAFMKAHNPQKYYTQPVENKKAKSA